MTKQTAVDWLMEEIRMTDKALYNLFFEDGRFEQAKEMEDEQRLEAWNGGIDSTEAGGKSYDQYYNETFKK